MLSLTKSLRAVVLLAAVAAAARPARAADLSPLAPADAQAVVVLNVRSLLDSTVYKRYCEQAVQEILKDKPVAEFLTAVSLDPLRDLRRVTVTANALVARPRVAVLLDGGPRFEAAGAVVALGGDKLFGSDKLLGRLGVERLQEGNRTYFTARVATPLGGQLAAAFVGNSLVVTSDLDYLKAIVGEELKATQAARTLRASLAAVAGTETIYGGLVATAEDRAALGLSPLYLRAAEKVVAVTATAEIDDAVDVATTVHAVDAEGADTLHGFVALLKLALQQGYFDHPFVRRVVETVRSSTEGSVVRVGALASDEALNALLPALVGRPAAALPRARGVAEVAAGLKADDPAVRRLAARRLEKHGPAAKAAVPALQEAREDADPALRLAAAAALAAIDPTARRVPNPARVPLYVEELKSPERDLRRQAADLLGDLGPAAAAAIPALQAALYDGTEDVRLAAVAALKRITSDARVLDTLPPEGKEAILAGLTRSLWSPAADERRWAAETLAKLGPQATEAVGALREPLTEALTSRNLEKRRWAAEVLVGLGPLAGDALPSALRVLTGALRDTDLKAACWAAETLARLRPEPREHLPELTALLLRTLRGGLPKYRAWAAETLALLGPEGRAAVEPPLQVARYHFHSIPREAAVDALRKLHGGTIAPPSPEARRAILSALKQGLLAKIPDERHWAAGTLPTLGPEGVETLTEGLVAAVKSPDKVISQWAADQLVPLRGESPAALPALVARLTASLAASDRGERKRAAELLARLGPDALPAATALVAAHYDPAEEVRRLAAAALARIDPAGKVDRSGPEARAAVLATLTRLLESTSTTDRIWAIKTVVELGEPAAPAVPAVVAYLRKEVRRGLRADRRWAAEVLGKLGPAARAAVPELREALRDYDPAVVAAAAAALKRIEP